MDMPAVELLTPTMDVTDVLLISDPSSQELYQQYWDHVIELTTDGAERDPEARQHALNALNNHFFQNQGAEYGAQIWVEGALGMTTVETTAVQELLEHAHDDYDDQEAEIDPDEDEEYVIVAGIELHPRAQVQGFFDGFFLGPAPDMRHPEGHPSDLMYSMHISNFLIRDSQVMPGELPEFHFGRWLLQLSEDTEIGIVLS